MQQLPPSIPSASQNQTVGLPCDGNPDRIQPKERRTRLGQVQVLADSWHASMAEVPVNNAQSNVRLACQAYFQHFAQNPNREHATGTKQNTAN